MWCPICREEAEEFEAHHVVWKFEKGTDHHANLLNVCLDCHVLLTKGSKAKRIPRDMAAVSYQMWQHGMEFIQNSVAGGHEAIDMMLEAYDKSPLDEDKIDRITKDQGKAAYEKYCYLIDHPDRSRTYVDGIEEL